MRALSQFLLCATLVALLILLPTQCAHAGSPTSLDQPSDHATLAFGPSLDGSTNPKMFAIGYEKVWGEFSLYAHCGALFENPVNPWCALVPSVRVETLSGIFMRIGVGPSGFIHTDDRLSSPFEFNISFAAGLYQDGFGVGVEGDHFSDAGLPIANPNPNLGSDHICAYVEIRF